MIQVCSAADLRRPGAARDELHLQGSDEMMRFRSEGHGRFGLTTAALALLMLAMAGPTPAPAQETVNLDADLPMLSLGDCVNLALGSSPTLLVSGEDRHIADKNVSAAWWNFAPDLNLGRNSQKSERTDFGVEQTSTGFVPVLTQGGTTFLFPAAIPNAAEIEVEECPTPKASYLLSDGFGNPLIPPYFRLV